MTDRTENFNMKIGRAGILPVVKIVSAQRAEALSQALMDGGLFAVEITFRTPAAAEAIQRIVRRTPKMYVCAGTVLTVENARQAVESGAGAVISPGTSLEVVRWCREHGIPVVPGCATPTEVEACKAEGLGTVKLFPAEVVGGLAMLRALAGPYADMRFMPTGGISPRNLQDYLRQKNVLACGGSWIAPTDKIESGCFAEITGLAREAAAMVAAVRGSRAV